MRQPRCVPHPLRSAFERGLRIQDHAFDLLFPAPQRIRSWQHWTPIDVADRMCALLAPRAGERILDVGSGVGKACLLGALATEASWVGIERDLEMVRAATEAARTLGVDGRVTFLLGEMELFDWSGFDGFYVFNPFAELLHVADG